ncbi:O-antigen polysaccharide polymerase Wzy [Phytohabitans suffuscus]|uniref:O-antigen polymerase n=1 Tax=Phytohabitans suffuscus TaxID=624315 RepID=A0A6F8YCQ0_9ACTN|nr:O-antigen polysaccharide polymerase Wzy [Phytohabitans suffuscus]BCB83840.1 hypothetical protein Psuf_011530 [Phytohabitans suffuscus]
MTVVADYGPVGFALVAAVAATAAMLVVGGRRDLLAYLAAYMLVFGFGPVVNYLVGDPVYGGVVLDEVGRAAAGMCLALLAMLVVGALYRQRETFDRHRLAASGRAYPLVPLLLLALSGYAVVVLVLSGPELLSGSKLDRVAAAGPWHYEFLLVELLACSLYFIAVRTPGGRALYWAHMGCYIAYCLATAERDFIFVLFSLLLHTQLFRRRIASVPRLVLPAVGLLLCATYLVHLRQGSGTDLTQVLNQGSVLFVDTFVMDLVPAVMPHLHGLTYLSAVTGLVATEPTLTSWLVDAYAPGSGSGYGFSLTGEAYLNFGLAGIPVVFALLAYTQRWLTNRCDLGQFPAFVSVLFTICLMYGFRGESATFLRTMVDGLVLYGLVHVTSIHDRRQPSRRWHPVAPAALRANPAVVRKELGVPCVS